MKLLRNRTIAVAAMVVAVVLMITSPVGARAGSTSRIDGATRYETAVNISKRQFASNAAKSVVLASGEGYADALAGVPLAASARWRGPLLLTPPGFLHSETAAEIKRVLMPNTSNRVFILGGTVAVSVAVEGQVKALGYVPVRLAGADRFGTAVDIVTRGLDNPNNLVLADGNSFADALVAGPMAAKLASMPDARGAGVLLTNGNTLPTATADYIRSHNNALRYAVGGNAAGADKAADPIRGSSQYDTARLVAQRFFASPSVVGVSSGTNWPDGLAGGLHIALQGGPMLLVAPGDITGPTQQYVQGRIANAFLYGGTVAVHDSVRVALDNALG